MSFAGLLRHRLHFAIVVLKIRELLLVFFGSRLGQQNLEFAHFAL
jgi:hypothetical protein